MWSPQKWELSTGGGMKMCQFAALSCEIAQANKVTHMIDRHSE